MSYHDLDGYVSKTMLNVFYRSPVEYYETYVSQQMKPKPATGAMELGTVAHAMLLEKRDFHELVERLPADCINKNGGIIGINAAKFRESIYPRLAWKQDEIDNFHAMYECVADSEVGGILRNGVQCERAFHSPMFGGIKCKVDIYDIDNHTDTIYDLKFGQVSPTDFNRSARNQRYWLQDAHYSAVVKSLTNKSVDFHFFAIETKYPYRVQEYWYDERSREIARESHARKMNELMACYKSNKWEDRWPNELTLQQWDVDADTLEAETEVWNG